MNPSPGGHYQKRLKLNGVYGSEDLAEIIREMLLGQCK
jgi:hypothetical protein